MSALDFDRITVSPDATETDPIVLDPSECRYLWRLHLKLAWRYFKLLLIQKLTFKGF